MMRTALDTLQRLFYKARPLGAVALGLWAVAAGAEAVGSALLPDGCQRVGEDRYRAPRGFDETLKYYKSVYPVSTYPRRSIINQPGVKAVHIVNPSGKNFEGLNIYEANDEVRIYIVRAQSAAAPPKPVKKASEGRGGKKSR